MIRMCKREFRLNMGATPDLRTVLGLQQGLEGRHIRVVWRHLRREGAFEKMLQLVVQPKLAEDEKSTK